MSSESEVDFEVVEDLAGDGVLKGSSSLSVYVGTQLLVFPIYTCSLRNILWVVPIVWMTVTTLIAVTVILLAREFQQTGRFLATTAPRTPVASAGRTSPATVRSTLLLTLTLSFLP
ncbi:hypothetical protein ACX80U_17120 [Arthrobacter sp. TmT3-37]